MPQEQFSNDASSTLNGTISSSATTLVVTSATLFPSIPQFRIVVEAEIMIVTGVTGTTFTVTRGAEGTTAASHTSGVSVTHVLTAGALANFPIASALLPTITITGDTSGSGSGGTIATTTTKINGVTVSGTPATGNQPIASSSTVAAWGALNLGGGPNYVTGQLPVANVANGTSAQILITNSGATSSVWVSVSGDATISAAGVIAVLKIAGITISGTPVSGNQLIASSSTSAAWGSINLAGGSSYISGNLPISNIAPGSLDQLFGTSHAGATEWFTPSGDVTLLSNGFTVTALQGHPVSASSPSAANILIYNTGTWTPTAVSGDATISATGTVTVSKVAGITISGTPAAGNQPIASSSTAAAWSSLNLAGGSNYVTGQLPVANLANGTAAQILITNSGATASTWVSMSGDATIDSTGLVTVGRVNGVSITGTPTAGNQPIATSSTAAAWGPLNLGGGANYVTGILPSGNQASQTMTGDVTGTTSASVVSAISGSSPITITPGTLRWAAGSTALLTQAQSTTSGAAQYLTITAQAAKSGSNQSGGYVQINGGAADGSGATGGVTAYDGTGTLMLSLGSSTGDTLKLGASTQTATLSGISLTFGTTVANPKISHSSVSTASATGGTFTLQAQNATGTTSTGGIVRIQSGSGTSANGDIQIYGGSTQRARIFEAQQHHLQLGDGGGTSVALRSVDFGLVLNDSAYGWSSLVVNSGYTFFEYQSSKSFLIVGASDPGLTSYIVPLIVDGSGNALFQRGLNTVNAISGVVLGALADTASSYVFVARGTTGQSANLITAQNATPSNVFEVTPSGNVAIGSAGSYAGGLGGVLFIANASTTPTTTPSGGGVLYVQNGALKYEGSSGSVTTLGPA